MATGDLATLGSATTHGQALPLGVDDPVIAARAVRRALASAGGRAVDVTVLVVASPDHLSADVLARFGRRALGPHSKLVLLRSVVSDAPEAEISADLACAEMVSSGIDRDGLGVALGLAPDGTAVARCVAGVRELAPHIGS